MSIPFRRYTNTWDSRNVRGKESEDYLKDELDYTIETLKKPERFVPIMEKGDPRVWKPSMDIIL